MKRHEWNVHFMPEAIGSNENSNGTKRLFPWFLEVLKLASRIFFLYEGVSIGFHQLINFELIFS